MGLELECNIKLNGMKMAGGGCEGITLISVQGNIFKADGFLKCNTYGGFVKLDL